MSLLEDRILRIIELKENGLDSTAIAQELGLSQTTVDNYYTTMQQTLQEYVQKQKGIEQISQENNFSPVTTALLFEHYKILEYKREQEEYDVIEKLREETILYCRRKGKGSQAELARKTTLQEAALDRFMAGTRGLNSRSINKLCKALNLTLVKKNQNP